MHTNLHSLIQIIYKALGNKLPGISAHEKMSPYKRKTAKEAISSEDSLKLASVLILFYEKKGAVYFILIKRTDYTGTHGGQISFPGGKNEQGENLKETALRETEEEIGINKNDITVLGELTSVYVPPSNFLISPFVGYLDQEPLFVPNAREVEKIIEVPLSELLDDNNVKTKKVPLTKYAKNNLELEVPYFELQFQTVWGATAVILSELKDLLTAKK